MCSLYLSWAKLERFVNSSNHPLENNGLGNSIRPFVVGRRNRLFADTLVGATASANVYSLLETC
ncbi:IS66 family transposase [Hydrogenophaga luteola]|uniref:Transposase n=1 Tax=Hydrogenophaga luteola TaxID=1591122 RepID=A0ABV7W9C5_9BURK